MSQTALSMPYDGSRERRIQTPLISALLALVLAIAAMGFCPGNANAADGVAPIVMISSPANGTNTTATSINVAYTVDGASSIPADVSCMVNGVSSTSTTSNAVALDAGPNSIDVTCSGAFGSVSHLITVTRSAVAANTTITVFASPSSRTTDQQNVLFTTGTGTSFECRINAQPFTACSSPWTLPLSANPSVVQGENTYEIRAVLAGTPDPTPAKGFIWIDDRAFDAAASVTPVQNTLVPTDSQANDAGAHPTINATIDIEGYDDAQSATIKFPDGLTLALPAISPVDRCTVTQAAVGACPPTSQIGTIVGAVESPSDGTIVANGKLYLVGGGDGLDPSAIAGVAVAFHGITGSVSGDLGSIFAQGTVLLSDQGRNVTTEIDTIPRITTTGKPFHFTSVSLSIAGDTGGAANPLITNPHFCNVPSEDFSARPDFQRFVGNSNGYNGGETGEVTADYIVDNCSAEPFNPSAAFALTDNTTGHSTGVNTTVTTPNTGGVQSASTLRGLTAKLPPFIWMNNSAFGGQIDACPGSAKIDAPNGAASPYYYFDSSACPRQARVGTARITTPMFDVPILGNIYVIDRGTLPDLGIEIDPNIANPDSPTGFNPQGVTIGLAGALGASNYVDGCTVSCEQSLQLEFASLPDLPMTRFELNLGGISGRVSAAPGNAMLDPNILKIASSTAAACRNAGDNAIATILPWSGATTATNSVLSRPTGCNDPHIAITTPANATNGGRGVNVANTVTTTTFSFSLANFAALPPTSCAATNALTGVTTAPVTATAATTISGIGISTGRNPITITCSNAYGSGTASRNVDRGIPTVFVSTPSATSTNAGTTQNVIYGVTANGVNATSPTLPTTTTLTGCTVHNSLPLPSGITNTSTSLGTNSMAIVNGASQISVTCANSFGLGTSQAVTVNKGVVPSVAISSPVSGTNTAAASINVAYTVNGGPSIPAGTNCAVNGAVSTNSTTNSTTLPTIGSNTITVACTNAFGTASASVSVNRGNTPVVAISSPANNSYTSATPINVTYTVDGGSTIPANTTCMVNGAPTTTPNTNPVVLVTGANTISVACANTFGPGKTKTITVKKDVAPTVVISSPVSGTNTTATSINVAYTVDGGSSIPAGVSCTVNGVSSTSTTSNAVTLAAGANSIAVTCSGAFGSVSHLITVTRSAVSPNTTISVFASPSSRTTDQQNVLFTTGTGTSFECRINAQPFTACSSPWTLPLSANPSVVQGENTYEVRAVLASTPDPTPAKGFIWVDNRAFNATASVTPVQNTLVPTDSQANDAGAHPTINATIDIEGYDDAQSATIKFPDGLMISVAAVAPANRCTVSLAATGDCPPASQIGTVTGTFESPTDGLITSTGTLHLIGAGGGLSLTAFAGVAIAFHDVTGPVSGNLGDAIAQGTMLLTDQSRNVTIKFNSIPRTTTIGKPFHLSGASLSIAGDTGGAADPLITNPHFCNYNLEDFSARPNLQQFVGTGISYQGSTTPEITADYLVDNCDLVSSNPTMDYSFSTLVAGSSTKLTASMTLPDEDSPIRAMVMTLPSFIATNLPSFGNSEDMCGQSASEIDASLEAMPSYFYFNSSTCPPQARVGTASIITPLFDYPIVGNVYLVDSVGIATDLGIDFNPGVANPDSPTGFNPQGVTLGLVGRTSTTTCNTSENCLRWSFTSLPDLPLNQLEFSIGGVTGRVGADGAPLNPLLLRIANPTDGVCRNAGGTVSTVVNPWRDIMGGGGDVTITQPLAPTGCNDPKITITAPANATTGGRGVNLANTTTTTSFTFSLANFATLPATTCTATNALTGVTTAPIAATATTTISSIGVSTGRNPITITCTNSLGSGTASRNVDRGIPTVFITTPGATSTNTGATQNVVYGVTANGIAATSPTLPATTTLTGCTVTNTLNSATITSTSLGTNSMAIVTGANPISVTCTNSFGSGTSSTVTVTKP